MKSKVLVTGGSGFVAGHIISQLLEQDHKVRTTIRNPEKEQQIRKRLEQAGIKKVDNLSFVIADLTKNAGWDEAVAGCESVLHVASPFPSVPPQNEDELIRPAKEGTLNVLRAARDSGVHRIVMISSFAAIGYGHEKGKTRFDETDWSNADAPGISAYVKSKVVAEHAAWNFIRTEGGSLELSVINPVGIFGPALDTDLSSSVLIIRRMLNGSMAACPRIYFGVVDVRDVAELHLLAMTHPKAAGERFLAVSGDCVSMFRVAQILKEHLGKAAAGAPRRQIPDWQIRISSLWNAQARQVLPNLGKIRNAGNDKAFRLLGWKPGWSTEDAIIATAESLIKLNCI